MTVNATTNNTMSSSAAASKISGRWQKKFAVIEKAGGPSWANLRKLPFRERSKVSFNILAFLFGPLYYLTKGMWKKAIVLTLVGIIALVALSLLFSALDIDIKMPEGAVVAAWFGSRANFDYYKKMVLGDNGWW